MRTIDTTDMVLNLDRSDLVRQQLEYLLSDTAHHLADVLPLWGYGEGASDADDFLALADLVGLDA
jgi:hypothetical protein